MVAIEQCAVPELLSRCARTWPRRVAIDFLGKRLRYGKLDLLVDRAAAGLQRLGLQQGDRVGLCLPNTPYFVIFYLAIMRAGGVVVNFNPLYTERELRTQILDSGTSIMIVPDLRAIQGKVTALAGSVELRHIVVCRMDRAMPRIKGLLFSIAKRRDIAALPRDGLHIAFESLIAAGIRAGGAPTPVMVDVQRDVALLQYTGGTTGVPKGAALTHGNLSANSAQVTNIVAGDPGAQERILGVLPLFHVFALTSVLNVSLTIGAQMILLPRFSMADTLRTIGRCRPTLFPAVPTLYGAISDAAERATARERRGLRSIRACISGGAPLPAEIKQRFEAVTGCQVVEGYGLSETSPVVCCNQLNDIGHEGSVGRAVPGTILEIRDLADPTIVLGTGERGEVCIRGPQVMKFYWNREAETQAVMLDGALRTGDVGYVDPDGYLFLVDRIKDLILCSGYNVYPRVIEEALYKHPDVLEATVIGIPDSYRGESPKAFVVLRPGSEVTTKVLSGFLEAELSRIEMPREIEIRESLPHTAVGKLSKKELVAEEAIRRGQKAA